MKSLKKKVAVLITTFVFVLFNVYTNFGVSIVTASIRNREILNDDFVSSSIDENNWFLVEGETENKILPEYGGDNGTLTLQDKGSWGLHSVYSNIPVTVEETEDLVIEYDFLSIGNPYFMGIIKGMQKNAEGVVQQNADATLEAVYSQTGANQYTMAGFSSPTTASGQIVNSERSTAVKDFLTASKALDFLASNVRHSYGLNFYDGVDYSPLTKSFRTQNLTYKHIFLASGGYECFAKEIGESDSNYVLILKTADTFGLTENDEKIYVNRSGYLGFTFNAESSDSIIEIDNFKVSTIESGNEEVVIDKNFNRTSANDEYNPEGDWGFTKSGAYSTKYPKSGLLFDNPIDGNYLYSTGNKRITNSGIYDNYFKLNASLYIRELVGDKTFGFLFGGQKSSDKLTEEGMAYVYFSLKEGAVMINTDIIKDGVRVSAGEAVATNIVIPANINDAGLFDIKITARLGSTIDVAISGDSLDMTADGNGQKIVNATFGSLTEPIEINNRFAIITDSGQETDTVVVKLENIKINNKWQYQFEGGFAKSVAESFDGVDKNGSSYINEDDLFILDKGNGSLSERSGVYVEDGELKFVSAGHGSGVAVRYAYDNWKMTFDITDMQREVLYDTDGETVIRTVSNSPIIICFGMQAEGVGYTTGKALNVWSSVTKLYGQAGYNEAVANTAVNSEFVALSSIGGNKVKAGFGRHNLLDEKLDGYTIRMQVEYKDGRLTLGYVVVGLEDYSYLDEPVLIYDNVDGEGYVGLTATHDAEGTMSGTFTIDNLRMLDTDSQSNILVTNKPIVPETQLPEQETPIGNDESLIKGAKPVVVVIISIATFLVGAGGCYFAIQLINKKRNISK